jgi:hypothetical protein
MTDLNIQSFKSVSESAKARLQKERNQTDLPQCMGFHNLITILPDYAESLEPRKLGPIKATPPT